MRERPAGIPDSDVAAALARQWALTVQDLSYLPVGSGGYHWLAAGQTGSRWFVTVSDLASPWVPDLPAAMQTAAWLATEAGLEFVVAPVPTRAGPVVGSLDSRLALTLFPHLDAPPSHYQEPIDDGDRAAIIDLTTGNKLTKTFINGVVQHSLKNSSEPAFAAYLQAWAKSDFTAEAKVDTATPVKLIVGVNDPAMSADVMEQTWRVFFPNAELTILPDAGHYPMFESPVSLATSIEEFLGRP